MTAPAFLGSQQQCPDPHRHCFPRVGVYCMWLPEAQSYLKVCGSEIPQNSKRAWGRRPLRLPPGRNLYAWPPRAELSQELWGTEIQPHLPPHPRVGCTPVCSVLREILTCHCCLGPWKQPGWLLRWAGQAPAFSCPPQDPGAAGTGA